MSEAGRKQSGKEADAAGVHVIRLRGPWEYRVLHDFNSSRDSDSTSSGRILMPTDWGETLGVDFQGRVAYTRGFARPTGLIPGQRVELVLMGVDAFGRVVLNDSPLIEIPPGGGAARVDIGPLLQDRNRLVVEVELPGPFAEREESGRLEAYPTVRPPGRERLPGGLYGEVRLEIHEPGSR